jgi:flotillin
MTQLVLLFGGLIFLVFLTLMFLVSRYKRCPSDKILVIYGRTSGGSSAKCIAGGAAFVWPVIQDYEYLDLTPISIDVDLRNALSRQNIRVNVPSRFTVAISNKEGVMLNAAERLLGKSQQEIRDIAKDIIFGQLRLVVATMDIEEINSDRDKFLTNVSQNVGTELRKIGLELINVNVTDIEDESGYIHALGKEAAAQAINEAKVRVAERERTGFIGEAEARKEQRIKVAEAEAGTVAGEAEARKEQRIKVAEAEASIVAGEAEASRRQRIQIAEAEAQAKIGEATARQQERVKTAEANALAVSGENQSKAIIAQSDAERRLKEAESLRLATAAEKIQTAKALEESYLAEQAAENARAAREIATQEADIIVQAEIAKRKQEIDAEAEAERIRRLAKGEADAIFLKQEAEAKGMYEVLSKQAAGFEKIVQAAGGNPRDAVLMLVADKLETLVQMQVDAIKNIKIDKVTVWENGGNNGEDGNSTSKFISGLYKAVPPMNDLFNMVDMDLPQYLGKIKNTEKETNIDDSVLPI